MITTEQRKKLENTVIQAREVAEEGARLALESLAVHEAKPYDHMNEEQRRLRTHLRARGRQLGDALTGRAMPHLISACAYEHWHRMLFARCLAENHLLLHLEMGVAITLDECEELAKEGSADKWQLASLLAQHMLPQIFRPDDPVLQVPLPREFQLKLEQLLAGLDAEIFQANDAIGWVYQFWQTKRKQEVNESNDKVGADELPSVTQLFTEDYMVDFMLDNTLGAWWMARHPEGDGRQGAERRSAALSFKYLRRKTDGSPMAGDFSQWPQRAAELKCLDPCCGSGHFLVALFERLVAMRMAEEELDTTTAAHAVLRDNLYGLEIDPRCTQLAAFNLALAAWKLAPTAVAQPLPELNIACCGLEIGVSLADWKALAPQQGYLMNELYKLFDNAVTYGSLIDPRQQVKTLRKDDLAEVTTMVERGLEAAGGHDYGAEELGVTAKGLTAAYRLLGDRYHLVATNVPYLARGKQDEVLRSFIETHYPAAKQDLATAFVERCRDFCLPGGAATLVTPQNWLFLGSYAKLREKLLKQVQWDWVARLGPRAFETISGEVVNVALFSLTNRLPEEAHELAGLDVSAGRNAADKAQRLLAEEVVCVSQAGQLGNPDFRVVLAEQSIAALLIKYANGIHGLGSKDTPRFFLQFWEIEDKVDIWEFMQTTVETTKLFGGLEQVVYWQKDKGVLHERGKKGEAIIAGRLAWGKNGVIVSQMRHLPAVLYNGEIFDKNCAVILPRHEKHLVPIWCFCSSEEFAQEVRKIDQKLNVTNVTLVKVPFDLERWQKVAAERYPNGLPEPFSNDPTQWIFHGYPIVAGASSSGTGAGSSSPPPNQTMASKSALEMPQVSNSGETTSAAGTGAGSSSPPPNQTMASKSALEMPQVSNSGETTSAAGAGAGSSSLLQIAVARLMGYRWPAELDPAMRLSQESRRLVQRCEELLPLADEDGIACIPSVRGEEPAVERLRALLKKAFGAAWSENSERELVRAALAAAGKSPASTAAIPSLDAWLRDEFFEQHCKLFHHRPFVWHIWDGRRRDGFHSLINYHKLAEGEGRGRKVLENLTYSYLGDWINRQKDGVRRGESGADDRLAAATELQNRLIKILEGEPPFDIFVRWKPLAQQAIGWEPDINDGVRLNIRPFLAGDLPNGRKGAGILRWQPNIKWEKDRGREPQRPQEEYPWFWENGNFTGNRVNEVHLTNRQKREARATKEGK